MNFERFGRIAIPIMLAAEALISTGCKKLPSKKDRIDVERFDQAYKICMDTEERAKKALISMQPNQEPCDDLKNVLRQLDDANSYCWPVLSMRPVGLDQQVKQKNLREVLNGRMEVIAAYQSLLDLTCPSPPPTTQVPSIPSSVLESKPLPHGKKIIPPKNLPPGRLFL